MKTCINCKRLIHVNENACTQCKISSGHHDLDISPRSFRRGYLKALFLEDEDWITRIEKYHMIVSGSPKSEKVRKKNAAEMEHLREQISADTYNDRKAYYNAWRDAPCCADDCDRYCDQCQNDGIKFEPIPTYGLDADVRRFIINYGRYQTASELIAEESGRSNARKRKIEPAAVLSGVRDGNRVDNSIWIREQERDGLFSQPEEVTSDQAERVEAMLSHPIGEEMVT